MKNVIVVSVKILQILIMMCHHPEVYAYFMEHIPSPFMLLLLLSCGRFANKQAEGARDNAHLLCI